MYMERDSRKTAPGKERRSGSEYLPKCRALVCLLVQELPCSLGDILNALANVSGRKHQSSSESAKNVSTPEAYSASPRKFSGISTSSCNRRVPF